MLTSPQTQMQHFQQGPTYQNPYPVQGYPQGNAQYQQSPPYQQGPAPDQNVMEKRPVSRAAHHPRVGFTRLSNQFHLWNIVKGLSGSSYVQMGPQSQGPVAYTARLGGGTTLRIKEGEWSKEAEPLCTVKSHTWLSCKSSITFNGMETKIKESSAFHEGAKWPFEVEVNGKTQAFQWVRTKSTSKMSAFTNALSNRRFGDWTLVPVSGGQPLATFTASGGDTFSNHSALGMVQFQGPAANGGMGDILPNVAIALLLRMFDQHYAARAAALAS